MLKSIVFSSFYIAIYASQNFLFFPYISNRWISVHLIIAALKRKSIEVKTNEADAEWRLFTEIKKRSYHLPIACQTGINLRRICQSPWQYIKCTKLWLLRSEMLRALFDEQSARCDQLFECQHTVLLEGPSPNIQFLDTWIWCTKLSLFQVNPVISFVVKIECIRIQYTVYTWRINHVI